MWSCDSVGVLGAALLLSLLTLDAAEAKRISYEIDGQTYTYESNDRAQVEVARERINAANAADEAREKARAELAAQPTVKFWGSKLQTEAAAAEAELKRVLADRASETTVPDRPMALQPAAKKTPRNTAGKVKEGAVGLEARASAVQGSEQHMPAPAVEETSKPKQEVRDERTEPRQREVPRQERSERAEAAANPDAEARARLIALFRERALAEEQRRLEAEKKRDRFARPVELQRSLQPATAFTSEAGFVTATRSQVEPIATVSAVGDDLAGSSGSRTKSEAAAMQATSGAKTAAAAASAPSRSQGLCTMTFSLLPGC